MFFLFSSSHAPLIRTGPHCSDITAVHRTPLIFIDRLAHRTHDVIVAVPDVRAARRAITIPRTTVLNTASGFHIVRRCRRITAGLGRTAFGTFVVDRAARAGITGTGSFRPGVVEIPFARAFTAAVIVVACTIADKAASGTRRTCIHRCTANLAVLMVRTDR